MLCGTCTSIFNDDSFFEWTRSVQLVYFRDDWRILTTIWKDHGSLENLRQAASGCLVCSRFSKQVEAADEGPVSYQINVRTVTPLKPRELDDGLVSVKGAFGLSIRLAPAHAEGRSGFNVVDFDLDEFEDDQHALNLSLQSLETGSTGSLPCLELARHWLRTCLDSHQHCSQSRSPGWYPSRLLHIDSSTDHVRLMETARHRPNGPYATLSHCWGAHPIDVLTPGNVNDMQSVGRPVEEFPQSFRDFIRTVVFLGLSYVWIDSFCILQGSSPASVRDWERESLLMEQVYANGLFNIAASFAEDSRGGCFQDRAALKGLPHRLDWCPVKDKRQENAPRPSSSRDMIDWVFDARSGMDQPFALQVELSGLHNKRTFAVSEYGSSSNVLQQFGSHHLFTRAWVAQEQMLPSRMLHFGKEQIWWQCHEAALLSETFPCLRPVRLQADKSNPATALRPGDLEGPAAEAARRWPHIVSAYTGRGLTKPDQDKLRAIQGIADRITKRGTDRYVHGIFWRHLPRALCWARMAGDAHRAFPLRAPSWSWASMNGQINLMLGYDRKVSTQLDPLPQALLAAIVTATPLDYSDSDQQHWARLVCVGRLLSMARAGGHDLEYDSRLCTFQISDALIKIELDNSAKDGSDLERKLYFLPIYERGTPAEPVGIALASNDDGSFSRIGVTKRYKPSAHAEILMHAHRAAKSRLFFLV